MKTFRVDGFCDEGKLPIRILKRSDVDLSIAEIAVACVSTRSTGKTPTALLDISCNVVQQVHHKFGREELQNTILKTVLIEEKATGGFSSQHFDLNFFRITREEEYVTVFVNNIHDDIPFSNKNLFFYVDFYIRRAN